MKITYNRAVDHVRTHYATAAEGSFFDDIVPTIWHENVSKTSHVLFVKLRYRGEQRWAVKCCVLYVEERKIAMRIHDIP